MTGPAVGPQESAPGNEAATVVIDAVHKSFSHPVLQGVSATITPGGITAFVGANGAGKTTLFNVISGFLRPDRGRILLGDVELSSRSAATIARAGVGRLFQDLRIFPSLSVLDNMLVGVRLYGEGLSLRPGTRSVRMHRAQARARARELLAFVELDSHLRKESTALSYGQQKRLGIARALMSEPRVLMLDEPSSGIDARNLEGLLALIERTVSPTRTILLIEHNRAVVEQLASRVLFLHQGTVLRDGSVSHVFNDLTVAERYLGQ